MNAEPPTSDDPKPEPSSIPKFVWVLLALSPSAIMILGIAGRARANSQQAIGALLIIDLVLSFLGSAQLLKSPDRTTAAKVIGVFFLGIFFAILNAGIALFAGCALLATMH